MKSWLTTFAIAGITILGAAPRADARHHHEAQAAPVIFISGYRACGEPVYTERYLIGYDRCGNPVWGYRVVEAPCPPRHYRPPPPRCEYEREWTPPLPHEEGYRRAGIMITGSFRL